MPIFRPRKFTFFPFLILFKRIESIDMTPCVISFLVYDDFRYLGTIIDKIELFYEGQWAQFMAMVLIFIMVIHANAQIRLCIPNVGS